MPPPAAKPEIAILRGFLYFGVISVLASTRTKGRVRDNRKAEFVSCRAGYFTEKDEEQVDDEHVQGF